MRFQVRAATRWIEDEDERQIESKAMVGKMKLYSEGKNHCDNATARGPSVTWLFPHVVLLLHSGRYSIVPSFLPSVYSSSPRY